MADERVATGINSSHKNENSAVTIELKQFTVTQQGAKEILEGTTTVKPGDVIEYQATYHNRDKTPVNGLVATLPIPVGMEYLPQSGKKNSPTLAATEDQKYESIPLVKNVKTKDGLLKKETISFADYRGVRWNIGTLKAGEDAKVLVRARVAVNDNKAMISLADLK